MKLSDILSGEKIVLDAKDAKVAWLFDELDGVLPRGSPIALQRLSPGATTHRFNVEVGKVWDDDQTTIDLIVDPQQVVTGAHFSRPGALGKVLGHELRGIEDLLEVSFDGYATNTPHISRFLRYFRARLHLTDTRSFTVSLLPIGNEGFTIDAAFDEGAGPSLADLGRLLGYQSSAQDHARGDLDWLPEELATGTIVELSDLRATVRHVTQSASAGLALPGGRGSITVDHVQASLRFLGGHSWPLIPGLEALTVGDLKATLEVNQPLEAAYRFPVITVEGTIGLDQGTAKPKAEIGIKGRWPDQALSGELKEGTEIDLGRLLQHLGVPAGDLPAGGLAIDSLFFSSDRIEEARSFSLLAEIEGDWVLPIGPVPLTLKDLRFHTEYQSQQEHKFSGGLAASVAVDDIGFEVIAEASGGGWQFEGRMAADSPPLKIGKLAQKIAKHFGDVALPDALLTFDVSGVDISFSTSTHNFAFEIDCEDTLLSSKPLVARLRVACEKQADGPFAKTLSGHLEIGGRLFDLQAAKAGSTTLTAVYASLYSDPFNIGLLAEGLGLPAVDFDIGLQAAMLALKRGGADEVKLAGVDIDGGIDISQLPLVGKLLPPGEKLTLALQVLYASRDMAASKDADLVDAINKVLPGSVPKLPEPDKIKQSLHVIPRLDIAGKAITLDLGIEVDSAKKGVVDKSPAAGGALPGPGVDAGGVKWIPVQANFGPAHISRIGGRFAKGEVTFLVDGSLSLGPLAFSMDGLSVSSPLTKPEPHFDLHGLGLDFRSGPLEIGGAFLRRAVPGGVEYAGAAVVRAKALSLSALGSYAEVDGRKSVFVYAVLDYPLGGPAFFFVTGLAAGLGYNRRLIAPAIAEVKSFPLIQEATSPRKMPDDLEEEIARLDRIMPISPGDYYLAVGVKFNSFKMIDSFALLSVTFGKHFEVDVLGLSRLVVPTPEANSAVTPLAEVEMALAAAFLPDAGILKVDAVLTDASYLITRNCKLMGGFSFYSWLSGENAGDFVVTLGGYNPRYNVPGHYPTPPRVGVLWHIGDDVQIKGDVYYALTPDILMAGGHMEATYHHGAIQAWCKVGADFLIGWKPFHYDVTMYVDIGGSLTYDFIGTHRLTIDLGAELHLWGPELAGHACVDLCVTHFDFDFRVGPSHANQPITWDAFSEAFLPKQGLLTIAVAEGLIETVKENKIEIWVVNPKSFRLLTDGFIPSTALQLGAKGASVSAATQRVPNPAGAGDIAPVADLGIATMEVPSGKLDSTHRVTVSRIEGNDRVPAFDQFAAPSLRVKQAPKSLWGAPTEKPVMSDSGFVGWAMSGIELTPKAVPQPAETMEIDMSVLLAGARETLRTASWARVAAPVVKDAADDRTRRDMLLAEALSSAGEHRRDELLTAFGLSEMVSSVPASVAADFIEVPHRVGP